MGDRPADAQQLTEPQLDARKRDWPLVVRRARPSDRDAVLAFATTTWDGWDYIPHAWPVWLEATDGVMLVATRPDDDTPIALTRVAMVSPMEAWWEGIRVDPALRGMDVATDLQVAELHWSAAQGANVIRYATSSQNEGSHRLGARHGIELLASYRNYWWSPEPGDPHDPSGFDADVRAEATQLRGRVLSGLGSEGRVLKRGGADTQWAVAGFGTHPQLYEPRPWAMCNLTWDRFLRHVDREEVITFNDRAVAILVREQLAGEDSSLRLALMLGDFDGLINLLGPIVAIAANKTVRFRLLEDDELVKTNHDRLLAAGYHAGEWPLHILGRRIDHEHPLPEVDPSALILAEEPRPIVQPLTF